METVRGVEDATALFESYHALADTAAIRQTLKKFEWTGKVRRVPMHWPQGKKIPCRSGDSVVLGITRVTGRSG